MFNKQKEFRMLTLFKVTEWNTVDKSRHLEADYVHQK